MRAQKSDLYPPPTLPDADFVHLSPSCDLFTTNMHGQHAPPESQRIDLPVSTQPMHDDCIDSQESEESSEDEGTARNVLKRSQQLTHACSLTTLVLPVSKQPAHAEDDSREDKETQQEDEGTTARWSNRPSLVSSELPLNPPSTEVVTCSPDAQQLLGGTKKKPLVSSDTLVAPCMMDTTHSSYAASEDSGRFVTALSEYAHCSNCQFSSPEYSIIEEDNEGSDTPAHE